MGWSPKEVKKVAGVGRWRCEEGALRSPPCHKQRDRDTVRRENNGGDVVRVEAQTTVAARRRVFFR